MTSNLYKREEKLVSVTDNWHPNFPDDEIHVVIDCFWFVKDNKGYVSIKALGYDDDYMELEYIVYSIRMMNDTYNALKSTIYDKIPDKVNHKWFEEHGLEPGI